MNAPGYPGTTSQAGQPWRSGRAGNHVNNQWGHFWTRGTRTLVLAFLLFAAAGLPGRSVTADVVQLLRAADGCLVVLTRKQGLYRECPGAMRPRWSADLPERPAGGAVAASGRLWLATREGLLRNDGANDWVPVTSSSAAWVRCTGPDCAVKHWGRGLYRVVNGEAAHPLSMAGHPPIPVQDALPRPDGTLLAASFGAGIHRLGSNAEHWEPLNDGLTNRYVLALAGSTEGTLYAATLGGGLYRLPAGATNWNRLQTLPATDITAVAIDADGRILLGTRRQGLWWSTDSGASWSGDSSVHGTIVSVALGPEHLAWAADDSGDLYRLGNGQWAAVPFRDGFATRALALHGSGTMVALQGRTLYRAEVPPGNWEVVASPIELADTRVSLAFDAAGTLYLGAWDQGLHASTDGGKSWHDASNGLPGMPGAGVRALGATADGRLLAVANDHGHSALTAPRGTYDSADFRRADYGVYRQTGHGWEPLFTLGDTPGAEAINGLGLLPGNRLLAWGRNGIGVGSEDGSEWQVYPLRDLSDVAPQLATDGSLWVEQVSLARRAYRVLPPQASHWASAERRPDDRFHGFLPIGSNQWLALTPGGAIARLRETTDGLALLSLHQAPLPLERFTTDGTKQVIAGARDSIFRSTDGGLTWTDITP